MAVRLILLLAGAFLTLAAAPSSFPATALRADDLRVASVGYRLAFAGKAYCPESYPLSGLLLHHLSEYDGDGRATEIARHSLDRGPGVLATVADSPAARAGIVAGDVLLAVNGEAFPDPRLLSTDRRGRQWRADIESSEARLEAALRRGPADLRILRGGQVLTVRLEPQTGCPARVRLARSSQANAFASGNYVVITTRILGEMRSDDELAILVGHEMAHIILHHQERIDGKTGAPLRTLAAEEEADRLGLKLAAAAGYDLHAAIPMWRNFYAKFGGGLPIFRSHPSLKARERMIEQAIADDERQGSHPPAPPLH
jgi:hypothetical protein